MYFIRKLCLGANEAEADFGKLGFSVVNEQHRTNLEKIIKVFLKGYNIALRYYKQPNRVVKEINQNFDDHHVGFAFEGSGMFFGAMDVLFPKKQSRLRAFIENHLPAHGFIAAVGAGLALGKAPFGLRRMTNYMKKLPPDMAWCVPDGYGFYQGIFATKQYIDKAQPPPAGLPEYGLNAFDSGLGRSIWWARCGSPLLIKATIDAFPAARRAELWSGIGVASTYAGGVELAYLPQLLELSGEYRLDYLSGVPFSARMRYEGGNYSEWTENACQLLLSASIDEIADMTLDLEKQLKENNDLNDLSKTAYELIRAGLKKMINEKFKKADVLKY